MLVPLEDGLHISFCAGKSNLVHERCAVGHRAAGAPFEHIGPAGIVIGQCEQGSVPAGVSSYTFAHQFQQGSVPSNATLWIDRADGTR